MNFRYAPIHRWCEIITVPLRSNSSMVWDNHSTTPIFQFENLQSDSTRYVLCESNWPHSSLLYYYYYYYYSHSLYRLEVFRNGVRLCPVLRLSCFTSISLGVSTVSKNLLLLHMSTPLPVHRLRTVPGIKYLQVLGLSTPSKYLSSNDFTLKIQDASTCKYLTSILLICWP